jgi:hypothetical protein
MIHDLIFIAFLLSYHISRGIAYRYQHQARPLSMKYGSSSQNRRSPNSITERSVSLSSDTNFQLKPSKESVKVYFPNDDDDESRPMVASMTAPSLTNPTIEQRIGEVGDKVYDFISNIAEVLVTPLTTNETTKNFPITSALSRLTRDMDFLDEVAARTPQLTKLEFAVLFTSVCASAFSPVFASLKVVEVIVPSMAALAASVGISAEYVGKVAMANGKEVAALAIQAAAEAEAVLANAERAKAILPLCVGVSTTASAFALLAPSLAVELGVKYNIQIIAEIFLFCPVIAVLSAAIAGLASQESRTLASKASGTGNRRFASSKAVGRTWLSVAEQVNMQSSRASAKWQSFAFAVALAPVLGALFPGTIGVKSVICAAIAAAQSAYYLSVAEYAMADAVNIVAMKSRSAAIADTYANQGTRAGAILPFTSALAGLSAAASAAAVEILPLTKNFPVVQGCVSLAFPLAAALFGAAASVSKARCEVSRSLSIALCQSRRINCANFRRTPPQHRKLLPPSRCHQKTKNPIPSAALNA